MLKGILETLTLKKLHYVIFFHETQVSRQGGRTKDKSYTATILEKNFKKSEKPTKWLGKGRNITDHNYFICIYL